VTAFDLDQLGRPGDEARYDVTADAVRAYAEATNDSSPAALEGRVAPPVFAIVPAWATIEPASLSVASEETRKLAVHYEQDMFLHRPIEAGMTLVARTTPVGLHARPNGTTLVLRVETRTAAGELVNEQWVTEFFRKAEAPESRGDSPPPHRLPDDAQGESPSAEITYPVDQDQTVRYAAASGDSFPIHLSDDFARSVGLPGRIVHGLCTMAFTGRAVLEAAGVDDPAAVSRLAVRFSAPLLPGDRLTTRIWNAGGAYAFEAVNSEGTTVVKDGRAELRPAL
jgi:acyl dehydratase